MGSKSAKKKCGNGYGQRERLMAKCNKGRLNAKSYISWDNFIIKEIKLLNWKQFPNQVTHTSTPIQ